MTEDDDQDLRRRFLALREQDARDAPDFAFLWRSAQAAAQRRPRPVLFWWTAAAAACVLVLVLVLVRHVQPSPSPGPMLPSASLGAWRAPTDFLLRTPAVEVLTTVPVLGAASLPPTPSPPIERSSPS